MPLNGPSSILLILPLLTLVLAGGSHYANDDPTDCQIIGDANIYGLGIRLSYYFQFAAAILSPYLAPQQLDKICVAFGASTLASYTAVYENAAQGNFIAMDWYIVSLLALGLGHGTLYFNPGARDVTVPESTLVQSLIPSWTGGKIKRSFYGPWSWLCLMSAMNIISGPYMYWKGINIGHKDGCPMHILFSVGLFSWNLDIYDHKWIVFLKIWSVVLLAPGLLLLGCGVIMLLSAGTLRILREVCVSGDRWIQALYLFLQAFVAFWSIFMIEMTLKNNDVDLSGTPITSAGQFIPLLIGSLTLGLVFIYWLRDICKGVVSVRMFKKYFDVLSVGGRKIERLFAKQKMDREQADDEVGESVELMHGTGHT
jgi:hypothetical protein